MKNRVREKIGEEVFICKYNFLIKKKGKKEIKFYVLILGNIEKRERK